LKPEKTRGLPGTQRRKPAAVEAVRALLELIHKAIGDAELLSQRLHGLAAGYETFRSLLDHEAAHTFGVELASQTLAAFEDDHTGPCPRAPKRDRQPGQASANHNQVDHPS
jgi:hypothetical protein